MTEKPTLQEARDRLISLMNAHLGEAILMKAEEAKKQTSQAEQETLLEEETT